jgi:hypothetical protein
MRGSTVVIRMTAALGMLGGALASSAGSVGAFVNYTPSAYPRSFSGWRNPYRAGSATGRNKPYRASQRHSGVRAIKRAARKQRRR